MSGCNQSVGGGGRTANGYFLASCSRKEKDADSAVAAAAAAAGSPIEPRAKRLSHHYYAELKLIKTTQQREKVLLLAVVDRFLVCWPFN